MARSIPASLGAVRCSLERRLAFLHRDRTIRKELRALAQERERDVSRGAVPLLGDDDGGLALQRRIVRLVVLLAIDEEHDVRVLLDAPRLSQIRELRATVVAALLGRTRELGERDDRDVQLLGERLEPAG